MQPNVPQESKTITSDSSTKQILCVWVMATAYTAYALVKKALQGDALALLVIIFTVVLIGVV